jgi:hypothetical protein
MSIHLQDIADCDTLTLHVTPEVLQFIGPCNDGRRHRRGTYLFPFAYKLYHSGLELRCRSAPGRHQGRGEVFLAPEGIGRETAARGAIHQCLRIILNSDSKRDS